MMELIKSRGDREGETGKNCIIEDKKNRIMGWNKDESCVTKN